MELDASIALREWEKKKSSKMLWKKRWKRETRKKRNIRIDYKQGNTFFIELNKRSGEQIISENMALLSRCAVAFLELIAAAFENNNN